MSHCPRLEQLPAPPSGRSGWPWTIESAPASARAQNGARWPRFSIITPSLNQGGFLEETIRSVLLQGYPDLEYVVVDGGSTDGSVDILHKYEPWLSSWVSEPDRGQSSAINKGLRRLTGEVFNWINSDDLLLPGSLQAVGNQFRICSDAVIAGDVLYRYQDSPKEEKVRQEHLEFDQLVEFWNNTTSFQQPGIFIPLELMKQVGELDEEMHFAFDYELFCRLLSIAKVSYLRELVAAYRIHPASKSVSQSHRFLAEVCSASRRYWSKVPDLDLPPTDPKGAGILFRVGCWQVVHGDYKGIRLIGEALDKDPWRAVCSTLRYFPGWVSRTWARRTAAKGGS